MDLDGGNLTVGQVAIKLFFSKRHVRELLSSSRIEGLKVGRRWVIPESAVDDYLGKAGASPAVDGPGIGGTQEEPAAREDPAQAESSGHWPALRDLAKQLQGELDPRTALIQLLGFPWMNVPKHLVIEGSGTDTGVRLEAESELIFDALKDHLPDDPAWDHLKRWKAEMSCVSAQLQRLCEWVRRQPGIHGRPFITQDKLRQEATGLTDYFASSIVLEVGEDLFNVPKALYALDVRQTPGTRPLSTRVLEWTRNSTNFAYLAASTDLSDLEQLTAHHAALRDRLLASPEARELGRLHRQLEETGQALSQGLERISKLVRFPSVCRLYSI